MVLDLVILVPLQFFNRRAYRLGDRARKDMTRLFEHNIRYFKGLKSIKAASAENEILIYFDSSSQTHSRTYEALERNHAKASLIYQMLSALFLVGLVYLALTSFSDQKTEIVVLIIIFARLAPRANAVQSYVNGLTAIIPEYLAAQTLQKKAEYASYDKIKNHESVNIERELTLSNVSFQYGNSDSERVLSDISLTLPVKSSTVIVGPSGAGKTTLVDIISGLLQPTTGIISIDGQALTENVRRSLSHSIHYIPDTDFLFDDTIRRNVTFGHSNVSESDIWDALRRANADNFVPALENGLDTRIGDSGTRLSHGQRQRLSLARGLIGNPQILILDEPTSALSEKDTKLVVENLKVLSRNLSLIIVTHDQSSFQWADQMITITDGHSVKSR